MSRLKNHLKNLVEPFLVRFFPLWWKRYNELGFWKYWKKTGRHFSNTHYAYFYTTHFGLNIGKSHSGYWLRANG